MSNIDQAIIVCPNALVTANAPKAAKIPKNIVSNEEVYHLDLTILLLENPRMNSVTMVITPEIKTNVSFGTLLNLE